MKQVFLFAGSVGVSLKHFETECLLYEQLEFKSMLLCALSALGFWIAVSSLLINYMSH